MRALCWILPCVQERNWRKHRNRSHPPGQRCSTCLIYDEQIKLEISDDGFVGYQLREAAREHGYGEDVERFP